ncbi:hypothetical protein M2G44_21875 [Vibrio vulnificus]|nr:hypothetical protein [Vibrio vulnificus]
MILVVKVVCGRLV